MTERKKVLVFGANGQLGQCLKAVTSERNFNTVVFAGKCEANILNEAALKAFFETEQAQFVVNCAAYTAVDKAEQAAEAAKAVNEMGAAYLAKACKNANAILIHISTDFVFDGNTVSLLKETDITKPVNVYGKTKLAGEKAITSIFDKHIIIRTSWLYSEFANNFVKTMLRLGSERNNLQIIADQIGSPTYAIDLAHAIINIIQSSEPIYGIYHYSNEGAVSWYDFAKAIFEMADLKVAVSPISASAYPSKAKRPSFSVMDKSKIKAVYGLDIPYWRESLSKCLKALGE